MDQYKRGKEIGTGLGTGLFLGHLLFTTLRDNANSQAVENITTALNKEDQELAIKLADALVSRKPQTAWVYGIRGFVYSQTLRVADAVTDLSKAIELGLDGDSELEVALALRSRCYQYLDDWGNAIRDINRAIQLNPNVYSYYGVRGSCLSKLGNTDQAIMDLNRAVEIDPTDPFIYSCRGEIYMLCRNFNKSIADFSVAINLSSNEPTFYRLRGEVYSLIGDNENSSRDNIQAKALEERQEEQERKKAAKREEQERKRIFADATIRRDRAARKKIGQIVFFVIITSIVATSYFYINVLQPKMEQEAQVRLATQATEHAIYEQDMARKLQDIKRMRVIIPVEVTRQPIYGDDTTEWITIKSVEFASEGIKVYFESLVKDGAWEKDPARSCIIWNGKNEGQDDRTGFRWSGSLGNGIIDNSLYARPVSSEFSSEEREGGAYYYHSGYLLFSYDVIPNSADTLGRTEIYYFNHGCQVHYNIQPIFDLWKISS